MCWIAFKRADDFADYFCLAQSRGLDWIGVINSRNKEIKIKKAFIHSDEYFYDEEGKVFHVPDEQDNIIKWANKSLFYQHILDYLTTSKKNSFSLLHHRKKSIGSASIANTHPFEEGNFITIQNGSADEFKHWGSIEYPMDIDKTDTFFLSKFISRFATLTEVAEGLDTLGMQLWVIAVVDKTTKNILFYSDGARSFYWELDWEEKIVYWSSLNKYGSDEYSFNGYIIANFQGKILKRETYSFNFKKLVTPTIKYKSTIGNPIDDIQNINYKNSPRYKWNIEKQYYEDKPKEAREALELFPPPVDEIQALINECNKVFEDWQIDGELCKIRLMKLKNLRDSYYLWNSNNDKDWVKRDSISVKIDTVIDEIDELTSYFSVDLYSYFYKICH